MMAVNRERMKVWREVTSLDLDYESLADVISTLERYRAEHGDACRIRRQDHAYDDGYYYAVMCERDETDAEMTSRIAQEEKWDTERLARERAEFERLMKKFGAVS
jgi:hypothetical protein